LHALFFVGKEKLMSGFRNWPFRLKIGLPMVALAVLFIGSTVHGLMSLRATTADANRLAHEFMPQINYILQADRDLYQAQIAERSILLLPEGASSMNSYRDQFNENTQQAKDRVNKFFDSANEPRWNDYRNRFQSNYQRWVDLANRHMSTRLNGQPLNGDANTIINDSEAAFQAVREALDQLTEAREQDAAAFTAEIDARSSSATKMETLILVIGIIISAAFVIMVPPLLVRPINAIRQSLHDISQGNGDLTARIRLDQTDELGQLVQNFNGFMDKLQNLIKQIQSTAVNVADDTAKLQDNARTSKEAIDHQGDALTMVATAVTEMASAIQEVARNTTETADEAKKANVRSEDGQRIVHQTITQIQQLSSQVQSAASVITHVEEEAGKVTSVIDVIRGIAEQTNLLALNAAIEAARAGEQGRGFAVVADEVRTLASRTQESTQDIQTMLQRLQQGVKEAVTAMNTSCDSARTTVETTEGAGKTLDEIKDAVSNITRMAIQIAAAAEEQSEVTEDINRNLEQINHYSDETATLANSTLESSGSLAALTTSLSHSVRSFRV